MSSKEDYINMDQNNKNEKRGEEKRLSIKQNAAVTSQRGGRKTREAYPAESPGRRRPATSLQIENEERRYSPNVPEAGRVPDEPMMTRNRGTKSARDGRRAGATQNKLTVRAGECAYVKAFPPYRMIA